MAIASVAANDRGSLDTERETEEKQAAFRERQQRLQEAQRTERMTQEEAEMDSVTGEVRMSGESVKLSSYAGPFLVAVFKDVLDFTIVLAFPGPATVITFCVLALIALLLFFPKRHYKFAAKTGLIVRDFSIFSITFLIEGLSFPLNILPFTVAAVGMIYLSDKKFVAARNANRSDQKKMKEKLTNLIRQASSATVKRCEIIGVRLTRSSKCGAPVLTGSS